MNILYIWIKEYGVIKNQGFTTTSEYNIKGELTRDGGKGDHDTFSLNIEENKKYIKDFFRLDQSLKNNVMISDITAIIGENGAGKSSFLNFIKNYLVAGTAGIQTPAVIVVKDGEKKVIYHAESIKIVVDSGNIDFKTISYSENIDFGYMNESRNTSFIFYSNIFDYVSFEKQWGNNYNISTNYLIQNDKKDAIEMKYYDRDISEVAVFRYKEIKRQIDFVRYYKDSIKFKLPDKVVVSVNNLMLRRAILKHRDDAINKKNHNDFTDEDATRYDESYPLVKHVYHQLNTLKLNAKDPVVTCKCEWYMAIFNGFFHNYDLTLNPFVKLHDVLYEYRTSVREEESVYSNYKDFKGIDFFDKILIFFKKLVLIYNARNIDFEVQWIESIIKTINFINKAISEGKYSDYFNCIILETDNSNLSIFNFLDSHDKAFSFRPVANFDWLDISSGEKAQLSMFSRFFSIVKNKKNSLKDNIIVLIDEGELYYHPQWQKEYIKSLIDLLEKIYYENNKKRKIQIILTANSPFIASDLPTKNIIFLKKENNYCKVVDGLEENIYTFGANIHTLLSDSFFMKEGLMGSFAKQKINYIVSKLIVGTSEELKEKAEEIETTISMIGEPIIRKKLQKMFKDKIISATEHNMNCVEIAERVSLLEKELEELKKERNN